MQRPVAAFLDSLSPAPRAVVGALREQIRALVPEAVESIAWAALSYHLPDVGGRVKGAVCQVVVRRGRVRLDFVHGVRLEDPDGLLRGDGVSKRWVPIAAVSDAERAEVAALIAASASFVRTAWA